MRSRRILFLGFLFYSAATFALEEQILSKDANATLNVPGLTRVAVGNSKIVKVKALPPSTVLVTGVAQGRTTVRVWSKDGKEEVYPFLVLSSSVQPASEEMGRDLVVKVGLQFLEMDGLFYKTAGIRWPDTIAFGGAATAQGSGGNFSGLNYAGTVLTADGFIRFLVQEGWGKILASPELYVRLGEEAVFHSGGEMPILTGAESSGRFYKSVEWKKYGLTAKVRPESPDRLHFSSSINLEISELNHAFQVEEIPSLIRRTLDTKMNSLDGETVILSGLVREGAKGGEEKVPVLGDIPLIGSLFTRKFESHEQTELLMALTLSLSTSSREQQKIKDAQERFGKTGKKQ